MAGSTVSWHPSGFKGGAQVLFWNILFSGSLQLHSKAIWHVLEKHSGLAHAQNDTGLASHFIQFNILVGLKPMGFLKTTLSLAKPSQFLLPSPQK